MAGLFASLSGVPVVSCRLVVPYSGIWHVDIELDRVLPAPLVGPQAFVLADSTWTCAPVRSGDFSGERRARLVGGTGGWRTPFVVVPAPLSSAIGVPIPLILSTASTAAKELPVTYVGPPTLGGPPFAAYVFQAGPPSLVLQDVLGDSWWMDPTGAIQTAPRDPTPIASPWTATAFDGAKGELEVATDSVGDWMPGASFLGPTVSGTVSRVVHEMTRDKLRSRVMIA